MRLSKTDLFFDALIGVTIAAIVLLVLNTNWS